MHFFIRQLVASILWAGLATAWAAPGAHGPDGEHLDSPAAVSASELARLPDGSVNVPKRAQRRMEIRTVIGRAGEHPLTVELSGRVAMDPNAGGRVQAPFAGRIEAGARGLPAAGQQVTRGQALGYLRPTAGAIERANQQAQLADLRTNLALAQKRLERLEALEGTVPRKEIEVARAELTSLTARERAVAASLGEPEPLVAPVTGVIASANAVAGQLVEARELLFEVIDPKRLIVEAYTADPTLAARIRHARLADLAGVELTFLGAARTLREGMLPLSFRARTERTALAIGQPVTVLAALADRVPGIALPAQAVVRSPANEPVVWVKAGAERFVPQPVEFRRLDAERVVVTKGLAPDNRVVVAGASLINQIR